MLYNIYFAHNYRYADIGPLFEKKVRRDRNTTLHDLAIYLHVVVSVIVFGPITKSIILLLYYAFLNDYE